MVPDLFVGLVTYMTEKSCCVPYLCEVMVVTTLLIAYWLRTAAEVNSSLLNFVHIEEKVAVTNYLTLPKNLHYLRTDSSWLPQ